MVDKIHQYSPQTKVIAALNGPYEKELLLFPREKVHPVASLPSFNQTVLTGLEVSLKLDARKTVRMNTAEHPHQSIPVMFEDLENHDALVVDLVFDENTMRADSADHYHNQFVMPELTL